MKKWYLACCLALLLAVAAATFPASSLGVGWAVRNTKGKVVGHAYGADGFDSVYRAGKLCGWVDINADGDWEVEREGVGFLCWVFRETSDRWVCYYRSVIGKVLRHDGKWLLKTYARSGHWKTRGTVSSSCPGYHAGAALRLLFMPSDTASP